MSDLSRANTDAIRAAEHDQEETLHKGGTLTARELVVYSALLATDSDTYNGHSSDLPRRAKAVVAMLEVTA